MQRGIRPSAQHTVTITGHSRAARLATRDGQTMASVSAFDPRVHFNPTFWQWYADDMVDPDDADDLAVLGGTPKLVAHENLHQTLEGLGLFAASKALDNRAVFGAFEDQEYFGLRLPV